MAEDYSVEVCEELTERFHDAGLHRPMRVEHYDAGSELSFDVMPVEPGEGARVSLLVEKFVGGGFAGQVYRVKVLKIASTDGPCERVGGVETGGVYAMKILIPPSRFSLFFRNTVYFLGFGGPFQPQVSPVAARAGALWQKFIRRAAAIRFGDAGAVNDIHVTFVDETLGSCGELSDWVDGRTWRLEVDEHLDTLKRWRKGKPIDTGKLGSPEYRAKHTFMRDFVALLHEMGAHEFARQYEWSTCKSQPNCLKRAGMDDDPAAGLTAVDFRAGLALLPVLPMSPGDFGLIRDGLKRGSLVQFDRGDVCELERFVAASAADFEGMGPMLDELKTSEKTYRDSLPDITHNHVRLLYDAELWRTMLAGAVTGWRVVNLVDDRGEEVLRRSRLKVLLFALLGLIPLLGGFLRKVWGRAEWRRHYATMLRSFDYLKRAVKGRVAEKVISWHRAGRLSAGNAPLLAGRIGRFIVHCPLSVLPASLHRFLTDRVFRREKLEYLFVRPVRLYFDADMRKQWLRDMVDEGRAKHMLSDEDADVILSRIEEPFIQKYLVSLVVHLMTLPVTQIVSVAIAVVYVAMHWGEPNAYAIGLGIIAAFQVIPISPGSICRGLYVVYMVVKDRDFKNYNIAVFLGFFKYVGYLAFPVQMTYHYPVLARFMASRWATDAVHVVPVFGEQGALLEHWIFRLFYNWPLTIRRRMRKVAELRARCKPRYWHVPVCALAMAALFALGHHIFYTKAGLMPVAGNVWFLKEMWYVALLLPLVAGRTVTGMAGGAPLSGRIVSAALSGGAAAVLYSVAAVVMEARWGIASGAFVAPIIWRIFVLSIFTTVGALIRELIPPDPEKARP